jgi:hypothetical protein
MDKLTTTIKRQWLREIVARRKKVEYREIKKYWTDRLNKVRTPFLLRLINGMIARAPEVTVRIDKVRKNARFGTTSCILGGSLKYAIGIVGGSDLRSNSRS